MEEGEAKIELMRGSRGSGGRKERWKELGDAI